jgi:hypothetical protein
MDLRFMFDSRKFDMNILYNIYLSYGRFPQGIRLGLVDSEDDLSSDVTGQPPLERFTRPGLRQVRVQHRPAACIDRCVLLTDERG